MGQRARERGGKECLARDVDPDRRLVRGGGRAGAASWPVRNAPRPAPAPRRRVSPGNGGGTAGRRGRTAAGVIAPDLDPVRARGRAGGRADLSPAGQEGRVASSRPEGARLLVWYDPVDPQDVLVYGRERRLAGRALGAVGVLIMLAGAGTARGLPGSSTDAGLCRYPCSTTTSRCSCTRPSTTPSVGSQDPLMDKPCACGSSAAARMGSVRDHFSRAWVAHGSRMGAAFRLFSAVHWGSSNAKAWEGPVSDVLYIGLTIVVFAVLFLLLKGVERFER